MRDYHAPSVDSKIRTRRSSINISLAPFRSRPPDYHQTWCHIPTNRRAQSDLRDERPRPAKSRARTSEKQQPRSQQDAALGQCRATTRDSRLSENERVRHKLATAPSREAQIFPGHKRIQPIGRGSCADGSAAGSDSDCNSARTPRSGVRLGWNERDCREPAVCRARPRNVLHSGSDSATLGNRHRDHTARYDWRISHADSRHVIVAGLVDAHESVHLEPRDQIVRALPTRRDHSLVEVQHRNLVTVAWGCQADLRSRAAGSGGTLVGGLGGLVDA